jgi:hypothetical protein
LADESIADAPESRAAADEPAAEELSAEEAASNEEEADPFPRSNRILRMVQLFGEEKLQSTGLDRNAVTAVVSASFCSCALTSFLLV